MLLTREEHEKWDLHTLECFIRHAVPPLSRKVLVLTFDDGYRSVLDLALPILEKHRTPATIFVTTDFVAGDLSYEMRLASMFENATEIRTSPNESLHLNSSTERLAAYEHHRQKLKSASSAARTDALRLIEELNPYLAQAAPDDSFMSWADLGGLAKHPLITIGGHGLSHCLLTEQPKDVIIRELSQSKTLIEDKVMHPVRYFAYPYGGHSAGVRELVKTTGYSLAFAARSGPGFHDPAFDPYAIPRCDAYELPELALL